MVSGCVCTSLVAGLYIRLSWNEIPVVNGCVRTSLVAGLYIKLSWWDGIPVVSSCVRTSLVAGLYIRLSWWVGIPVVSGCAYLACSHFIHEADLVAPTVPLQDVADLLQYMSHSDPQLKGTTAVLVGNLLHAALVESSGDYSTWVNMHTTTGTVSVSLSTLYECVVIYVECE